MGVRVAVDVGVRVGVGTVPVGVSDGTVVGVTDGVTGVAVGTVAVGVAVTCCPGQAAIVRGPSMNRWVPALSKPYSKVMVTEPPI